MLAATGAPLTHEAVATSEATELRIGCYVFGKESFVRAYLDQDLGGADTAQVSWGATGAQTEEWSLDQWEVSLEVPGGIGNLAIAAEIEAARDAGTLRLVVSPEGGSLRHQVELNLAGSLPALTAVRDKCATAFSGQP